MKKEYMRINEDTGDFYTLGSILICAKFYNKLRNEFKPKIGNVYKIIPIIYTIHSFRRILNENR